MPHKRKRGVYSGWFVEIPKELKEAFDELYPGRRNKRLFTVAFLSWAVRHKPDIEALNKKWTGELENATKQRGASGPTVQTEATEHRANEETPYRDVNGAD